MENTSYLICLLRNVKCYGVEAVLEVYLIEETNKRHPKQIKQQENDNPGYFVLNFKCFELL